MVGRAVRETTVLWKVIFDWQSRQKHVNGVGVMCSPWRTAQRDAPANDDGSGPQRALTTPIYLLHLVQASPGLANIQLAQKHASRCNGPWAARGQARLAHAIGQLGKLATTAALPANNAVALADAYANGGWQADDAVIRALDAVAPRPDSAAISHLVEDRNAVVTAIRAIYAPRLEREASTLQAQLASGMPASQAPASSDAVLFVDGLRGFGPPPCSTAA